ncbi:hypothetical protein QR680_001713 [Steinernema hermaphroditum]|uniref:Uncharacterized protein n=1 Tax=Steinernema hermaphroditum TaxID=289476 RepID=A0AA39GZI6_9BILA|nr:hypothetical protein QR680_001713 [Steinernema hermaphroditum]
MISRIWLVLLMVDAVCAVLGYGSTQRYGGYVSWPGIRPSSVVYGNNLYHPHFGYGVQTIDISPFRVSQNTPYVYNPYWNRNPFGPPYDDELIWPASRKGNQKPHLPPPSNPMILQNPMEMNTPPNNEIREPIEIQAQGAEIDIPQLNPDNERETTAEDERIETSLIVCHVTETATNSPHTKKLESEMMTTSQPVTQALQSSPSSSTISSLPTTSLRPTASNFDPGSTTTFSGSASTPLAHTENTDMNEELGQQSTITNIKEALTTTSVGHSDKLNDHSTDFPVYASTTNEELGQQSTNVDRVDAQAVMEGSERLWTNDAITESTSSSKGSGEQEGSGEGEGSGEEPTDGVDESTIGFDNEKRSPDFAPSTSIVNEIVTTPSTLPMNSTTVEEDNDARFSTTIMNTPEPTQTPVTLNTRRRRATKSPPKKSRV